MSNNKKSLLFYFEFLSAHLPPFPFGADDMTVLAKTLRLLDRKETLISGLRQMNDEAEKMVCAQSYNCLHGQFKFSISYFMIDSENTLQPFVFLSSGSNEFVLY
jgi:hypothetical protein